MVEGGSENDMGDFELAFHEFLEDAETVKAGDLVVEDNEVGIVLFDEVDGVETVFALRDEVDF